MSGRCRNVIFHILSVILLLASLALGLFVMQKGYYRIVEAGRDFGTSIAYWFCEVFGIEHNIHPYVIDPPAVDFGMSFGVSETGSAIVTYFKNFFSGTAFGGYFGSILSFLVGILPFSLIIILAVVFLVLIIRLTFYSQNNRYNRDTIPLKVFKAISKVTYRPIKAFVLAYRDFLDRYKVYSVLAVIIWLINVNVVSIALDFLAYLFFFSASASLSGIGVQMYKLLGDLGFMLKSVPFVFWIILAVVLICRHRISVGYWKLEKRDAKNRELCESLPVVSYFTGNMGTGKDVTLTYLALLSSIEFRRKAYNLMLNNDLRFPNFPWINLENDLRRLMLSHSVFNMFSIRQYISQMRDRFFADPKKENIWDYDFEKYPMCYDDKLKIIDIWTAISNYAQEYFLYVIDTSLIFANHSIREDNRKVDKGNFPLWINDFYKRDTAVSYGLSKFAHIFDYDMFRFGVKFIKNNIYADSVEFGVFVGSEWAKDRGNQLDNASMKREMGIGSLTIKDVRTAVKKYSKMSDGWEKFTEELRELDEKSSPLNDYMNLFFKMMRHLSTIDGECFIRFIGNDQRAMSLNADMREIGDVFDIESKSARSCALPFFIYDKIVFDFMKNRFKPFYEKVRVLRGDNTLLVYIFKNVLSAVFKHYERMMNKFGVFDIEFVRQNGKMEGDKSSCVLRCNTGLIFADRYSTDCFAGLGESKVARSTVGICDVPSYAGVRATTDELLACHGRFVKSVVEHITDDEQDDEGE